MANILSVKQVINQLKDKLLSSFNNTATMASSFGVLLANMDDDESVRLYYGQDDEAIGEVSSILDYIDSVDGVTMTLDDRVIELSVDHELDERILNLRQVLSNGKSGPYEILYTDGGDIEFNKSKFTLADRDYDLYDMVDKVLQSANINQVIIDALDVSQQYGADIACSSVQSADARSKFISLVNSHVTNLNGDAASAFQLLSNSLKYGSVGVLTAIKTLYTSLKSSTTSGNKFEFIDNSDYKIQRFGVGTVLGLISNIGQILTPILAIANVGLGLIAAAISFVANTVTNIVSESFDKSTYACIDHADAAYLEFPYGILKGKIIKYADLAKWGAIMEACPTLREMGSCRIQLPGFGLYLYLDTETEIMYYQARLSALSTVNAIDAMNEEGLISYHFSTSSSNTDYITFNFRDLTSAEVLQLLIHRWFDGCSDSIDGNNYQENDQILQSRIRNSVSWLIMLLFVKYCQHKGYNTHTFTFNDSDPSVPNHWLLFLIQSKINNYAASYNLSRGWKAYYDKGDPASILGELVVWLYNTYPSSADEYELFTNYIAGLCNNVKTIRNMPWYPLGDAGLEESFENMGENYISLPKYDRSQAIRALVLTTAATVIVVATAILVTVKVSRAIKARRASLKAKAEHAWDNFKADPTSANYNSYYKSVKKNNRFVKLFGGSALSSSGYWDATDTDTTANNTSLSDDIMRLIKG